MSACVPIKLGDKVLYAKDMTKMGQVSSAAMETNMVKNPAPMGVAAFLLISLLLSAMGKGQFVAAIWTILVGGGIGYVLYRVTVVNAKIIADNTTTTCSQNESGVPKVDAAPKGVAITAAPV